jgi:hypothetical protein
MFLGTEKQIMVGHADLTRKVKCRGEIYERVTAKKFSLQQYGHPKYVFIAIEEAIVKNNQDKCIVNLLYNSLSDGARK